MSKRIMEDTPLWGASTYPALMCFGDAIACWRLLDMAVIAQKAIDEGKDNSFYQGKVKQATYFTDVTLPLTVAQLETCVREGREVIEIPDDAF